MIQAMISGRYAGLGEEEFSRQFDKISFRLAYVALNVAIPVAAQIR